MNEDSLVAPEPQPPEPAGSEAQPVLVESSVAAPEPLHPAVGAERVDSVDVLRGFALLGILVMNIVAFALPGAAYSNPLVAGGPFEGANRWAWVTCHLIFEMKFMTIFSMLFGAGIVLFAERSKDERDFHRIWFRRLGWLAVIGFLHGHFLWWGDILFSYAMAGFFLWKFRHKSVASLLKWGIGYTLFGFVVAQGFGVMMAANIDRARAAEAKVAAGGHYYDLDKEEREAIGSLRNIEPMMAPRPWQLEDEIATHRGPYWGIVLSRMPEVLMMQTVFLVGFLLWRLVGTMLIGMALMRAGVFAARCTNRFYLGLAAAGYGLGLPMVYAGMRGLLASEFDLGWAFRWGGLGNGFGSIFVALGHVAVVMLVIRSGALGFVVRGLSAVGRTAFSNYLFHSAVLTTVFYGYGFNLFGTIDRAPLLAVVLVVWAVEIPLSVWWTKTFRFGPAEWVWRSLTYGERQPMRLARRGV